jgi:NDP-sugar pyrophosphorylase family protein
MTSNSKNVPTLLVLAAGMGSRYGGLKQIDPVGPNGETLMDYSLFDAHRAGFTSVVFLIRKEMRKIFEEKIGAKYDGIMQVQYAYQSLDDLPGSFCSSEKREKPWGTGHAVWCARNILESIPFAVINADDFYGADTFHALVDEITAFSKIDFTQDQIRGSLVGYDLRDTLSDHGTVSRGICKIDQGYLQSVKEYSNIGITNKGIQGTDACGKTKALSGEETVSMNVWAFSPAIFQALERGLTEFLEEHHTSETEEFYLPSAVDEWIESGVAVFKTSKASCKWMGVTFPEDKRVVVKAISKLISRNMYPASMF